MATGKKEREEGVYFTVEQARPLSNLMCRDADTKSDYPRLDIGMVIIFAVSQALYHQPGLRKREFSESRSEPGKPQSDVCHFSAAAQTKPFLCARLHQRHSSEQRKSKKAVIAFCNCGNQTHFIFSRLSFKTHRIIGT